MLILQSIIIIECMFCFSGESDNRCCSDLEELLWTPFQGLNDRQIDQFMVVARSVGTFARALDCSSSVKQPSLHMSAAAASRDVTLVSTDGRCFESDGRSYYILPKMILTSHNLLLPRS